MDNLNINLLKLITIENDFINNCQSNFLADPPINKPIHNANNKQSITDTIHGKSSCTAVRYYPWDILCS